MFVCRVYGNIFLLSLWMHIFITLYSRVQNRHIFLVIFFAKLCYKSQKLFLLHLLFLFLRLLLLPVFTFLRPFLPLALRHKLSVPFTILHSPPPEQCICSPPPLPASLRPSICLFTTLCDISAMPGDEGERGWDKLGYCQAPGISIVFLLSRSGERWPLTFWI